MMDIAVVGLGVMGQNLALNMAGHGFSVSGIDIDSSKTFDFVEKRVKQENIIGFGSMAEAAASLSSPKKFPAIPSDRLSPALPRIFRT